MQALPDSIAPVLREFAEEEYIARTVRFFTDPIYTNPVTPELHPGLVAERLALFDIIKSASASVNLGGVMIGADNSGIAALKIFARAMVTTGQNIRGTRSPSSALR